MKAVIMAGGEGTRLRPLTCDLPKPMARLLGRPVIEHILNLLAKNDVKEAAVTLRYLPEIIKNNFPDSSFCGIKLDFIVEDTPLGTAGGVLNAVDAADEDIIVISGDAMCDFDLKSAVKFHKEKGADATLVLSRVADPREYGLVVTDAAGSVRGFVEKPGWAQAVTDAVNTGIYIISKRALALIPSGEPYDFAKDLFPKMLSMNMKICGFEADGYWCDIGDIGAYTSCQFEMLDGYVDWQYDGIKQNGALLKKNLPRGNYKILPPVYIGEGVKIGDFSVIGPFAVLDDNCSVGSGATVKNSVLLPGSFISDHCELRGALVCAGASLKRRAGMYEGSVAGACSVVGADACVSPGVRIWPGKNVEDGARASANIKTGCAHHSIFDDEGISGEIGADITPEMCAKIGAAAAGVFNDGKIGVCCDSGAAAVNLKNSVAAGVVSAGAEICDFETGFESMFSFAVDFLSLDMGIFVKTQGNRAIIKLIEAGGLGIGRAKERKIEAAISTGDLRRCPADKYRRSFSLPGIKTFYKDKLLKSAPSGFNVPIMVKSPNSEVRLLTSEIIKSAGMRETNNPHDKCIRLHVSATGKAVSFFCEDGTYINLPKTLLLGCAVAFDNGEDVALPFDSPNAIKTLSRKYNCKVLNYFDCPTDKSDSCARELAKKDTFVRDGIENALRILSFAKERSLTLSELNKRLPEFAVTTRAVNCSVNPGRIMRRLLHSAPSKPTEGVTLERAQGSVFVSPMKRGTGIRIIAEAGSMEIAGELCADMERELRSDLVIDKTEAIDNNLKTI